MKKIYYFTAKWCGPCKMFGPIIDQLRNEGAPIIKVDADENKALIEQYSVRNVPTLLFLKDDIEVNRLMGAQPKQKIKNIIDSL